MFEHFKARLHSNEVLLKSWQITNKSDDAYQITKEFNFDDIACYSDICTEMLKLEHSPSVLVKIEKIENKSGNHQLVVCITISATEAETLSIDCQKLALSVEHLIS